MNECDIFMAALDIDSPEEREAYLDEACRDDTALRRRVETLLESHARSGSLLEHPAAGTADTQFVLDTEKLAESRADEEPTLPGLDEIPLDFLEPSDLPDSLGRLGQYEVQEVVGRGGMGIVLKAHDTKLSRVVAVKVLAPELAAKATARKRFLREARAAAAVSHDHVVTTYAVEENEPPKGPGHSTRGGPPYLVMEFIDGESLEQKIDREGHLAPKEVLRIGRQIAAGLSAAHEQGLIHRDIKPSNILLQNGVERVQITDFGLARAADDVGITRTGEIAGTPQYMSPEQAEGKQVDARSDLFSLGSVLYTMCTGRSPFRAETTMASLRRVCEDTPRPIRQINPEVPEWLSGITDRLLEKNPNDRFQSAEEVCDLLGECLAHVQDPAVNRLPASLAPKRAARRKRSLAKSAAGLLHGRRWIVAAAVLIGVLALVALSEATGVTNMAATVIRIATGEGTLVIEVDDPTVQVSLDGEELSITGAGLQEVRLRPGQYQFRATKDGEPVKRELVSITRGGRQVVRVTREPTELHPRSEGAIEKAIEVDPNLWQLWKDRADLFAESKKWDSAIAIYTSLLKLRPDDCELWAKIADAYFASKHWDKAIDASASALRINPKHIGALSCGAWAFRLSGRWKELLETANMGLQVEPENAEFLMLRGVAHHRLGAHAKAIADYNEAIRLDPKRANWYELRAEAYLGLARYDEALADCNRHVELKSNHGAAALSRALMLLVAGRAEEYRQACLDMLDRAGQSGHPGDAYFAARTCLLTPNAIADPIHTIELAKQARSDSPQLSWTIYTLGMAHLRAGELEEATKRFHEALEASLTWDSHFLNWLGLALAQHHRGETKEARKSFGKAVELMERNPDPNVLVDRLEGQLLWREVEQLLGKPGQALTGTVQKDAFVVLAGDGAEVAKFDTLAEAVVGSTGGDTIEIRGNGPFVTDQIEITHPLTIRAGDGFRPVIRANSVTPLTDMTPLLKTWACLTLQGIELQGAGGERVCLVKSHFPFHAVNCRFLILQGQGNCIVSPSSGLLRNCELISWSGSLFWFHPLDEAYVIENSLLVGTVMTRVHDTKASLRLSRNTMMNPDLGATLAIVVLTLPEAPAEDPLSKSVRITASCNIVDSGGPIFGLAHTPQVEQPEALLPRLLGWREAGNLYRSRDGFLRLNRMTPEKHYYTIWSQDLEDWNLFWGLTDTGSSQGVIRYQGGDVHTKALANPEKLTAEDFRLRPDSAGYRAGPDGKDLGADIDLVGPGEAYERWKKTPEYEEWQKETREMMKAALADHSRAAAGSEADTAAESPTANAEDDQPLVEDNHGA